MDVLYVLINFPFVHFNKITIGRRVVEEIWELFPKGFRDWM